MDSQQGATPEHMELWSALCGGLDGMEVWGRMYMYMYVQVCTCICMAGSLCSTPETITLFVNWLNPNPKNGFFDSSAGKEFACNPGDPGLIPGSGRFTGEGIGYPL